MSEPRQPRRYETIVRNKFVCTETNSFDEFIQALEAHVMMLKDWRGMGVKFDPEGGTGDDYATFYTEDEELAKKLGFEPLECEEDFEQDFDENDPDEGGSDEEDFDENDSDEEDSDEEDSNENEK